MFSLRKLLSSEEMNYLHTVMNEKLYSLSKFEKTWGFSKGLSLKSENPNVFLSIKKYLNHESGTPIILLINLIWDSLNFIEYIILDTLKSH